MQIPVIKQKPRWIRLGLVVAGLLLLIAAGLWIAQRATVPTGVQHYLFAGKDNWGSLATAEQGRADAILLITLDSDAKSVSMTSFLRDTMVDMPGGSRNRLNTLARIHGDEALRTYVEDTYALDLAGMFSINFSGAMQVIDALGGVTINLTRAEVSYLRRAVGDFGPEYILREGPCRLNGAQALSYMRCRNLDSDFGRIDRQANMLAALMQEARGMSLNKVLRVVPEVMGNYATGLSLSEQLTLARHLYALRNAPLRRHQLPAPGTYRYTSVGGSSMLRINVEKNKELLQAFLAGE
ncbi:MAG: LCP family protein [Clostridia bacterium]|nr:LCP family protein [Clostridia bacterium]